MNHNQKESETEKPEKGESFTQICKKVYYNKALQPTDIHLYLKLYDKFTMFLSLATDKYRGKVKSSMVFNQGQESLAREFDVTVATLNRSMNRLEGQGYLVRIPFSQGAGKQRVNYVILNEANVDFQKHLSQCFNVLDEKAKAGGKKAQKSLVKLQAVYPTIVPLGRQDLKTEKPAELEVKVETAPVKEVPAKPNLSGELRGVQTGGYDAEVYSRLIEDAYGIAYPASLLKETQDIPTMQACIKVIIDKGWSSDYGDEETLARTSSVILKDFVAMNEIPF